MKAVHIFDMDDTLLLTPTFASFTETTNDGKIIYQDKNDTVSEFLKKLKSVFLIMFSKDVDFYKKRDYITVFDSQNKKPLYYDTFFDFLNSKIKETENVKDPEKFKKIFGFPKRDISLLMRSLDNKEGYLIISQISDFFTNPDTIGVINNSELIDVYNNAKNKMILTGRREELRKDIENKLKKANIQFPNLGLFLYTQNNENPSIKEYKANVVINSVINYNWDEIHFYEDNETWLSYIKESVLKKFPNVKFIDHHIQNLTNLKKI